MEPEAPGLESSIIGAAHNDTKNFSRTISKIMRNFLKHREINKYLLIFSPDSKQ